MHLWGVAGLVLSGCALAQRPRALPALLELGPMVGHVGPEEARIWVKASGPAQLGGRIGLEPDLSDGREVAGPRLEAASGFVGTLEVNSLKPSTRYFYQALLDGRATTVPPYPSFTTAPAKSTPVHLRFAFTSCLGPEGRHAAAGWGDLAERVRIDFLLLLGDNHYANSTQPDLQRRAYASHRSVAGFRDLTRRTPTYGIWDDHDYGPDNSDGTTPGKERSLQTFKEYWPNPAFGSDTAPGIWYSFSWGDVDFFMLDVRYHRTPNQAPDDSTKTMLGAVQRDWLKRGLLASKATIKFIASGSEWQTHGSGDSWTKFAREREEIFRFIEENGIEGVMLLSGDRHFVAGYQVRGKWIEITSGPLGSSNASTPPLPEMFMNHSRGKLYTVYDVDTTGPGPTATIEVYRAGEGLLQKRRFDIDEIHGRTRIPPLSRPASPRK